MCYVPGTAPNVFLDFFFCDSGHGPGDRPRREDRWQRQPGDSGPLLPPEREMGEAELKTGVLGGVLDLGLEHHLLRESRGDRSRKQRAENKREK